MSLKETDPEKYATLMARLEKAREAKRAKAAENQQLKESAKVVFATDSKEEVPAQKPVETEQKPVEIAEKPVPAEKPVEIAEKLVPAEKPIEEAAELQQTAPVSLLRIPAKKKKKVQPPSDSDSSDGELDVTSIKQKYKQKYAAKYAAMFQELRKRETKTPLNDLAPAPSPAPAPAARAPAPAPTPANTLTDFQRASTALARQTIARSLNEELIKATMRNMMNRW